MSKMHTLSFLAPNHVFFDSRQITIGEGVSIEVPCICNTEQRGFPGFEEEISNNEITYQLYDALLSCGSQFGLGEISELLAMDKIKMRSILLIAMRHRIIKKISSQYKLYDKGIKETIQTKISMREIANQQDIIKEEVEETPGLGLFRKLSAEKDRKLTSSTLKPPTIVRRKKKVK